jgi:peptidoglycan hydrolase-like protein with peptidoglycan-binding domain
MSRQTIIDTAAAENGTTEVPANSNLTKYGKWYGLNGVAWCAMFVSWVYNRAGHPLGKIDDENGYRYCPSAYNFWKAHNRLTTDPQMGDIVLFDWTGDGKCDHTGIFVAWKTPGKTFTSWEGNTAVWDDSNGGNVMMRTRNNSMVKAFVNPGVIDNNSVVMPLISQQRGSVGSNVTQLQKCLYNLGYTIIVDGSFGPGTEKIVKQFQREHGLDITGIANLVTKGAIEAELAKPKVPDHTLTTGAYLKKGDAGAAVLALQKALNKKGANPAVNADGVFGNGTLQALKAFQAKNGLTADGIAGPATARTLKIK